MKSPDTPADETTRISALRALDVLDSPPEERFDRFTRLAKRLFGVPIALVSLVDTDRQWFKSCQGLPVSETGRDISFCGHAILGSEIFVVENAAKDERFHDNPLVAGDPNIRFYAGCPLPGPNGQRLGTLCIIDREPRELDDDDLEALRDIGAMVAGELGSLRLATTDSLTGLSNRRGFQMLSQQVVAMSRRTNRDASYVLIDMDGFKAINDELGHEAGDAALVEFSELMLTTFRDSDIVARAGGDEFCVLLTGTDVAQGELAVARLRAAVRERNARTDKPYALAFSAGVAACHLEEDDCVTRAACEADRKMYENKKHKHRRAG